MHLAEAPRVGQVPDLCSHSALKTTELGIFSITRKPVNKLVTGMGSRRGRGNIFISRQKAAVGELMVEVEVGSGGRGSGEGGALILTPQGLFGEGLGAQACRNVALDHLLPHSLTSIITRTRRVMPRNIHFSPAKLRSSEPRPRACAWEKDAHL